MILGITYKKNISNFFILQKNDFWGYTQLYTHLYLTLYPPIPNDIPKLYPIILFAYPTKFIYTQLHLGITIPNFIPNYLLFYFYTQLIPNLNCYT